MEKPKLYKATATAYITIVRRHAFCLPAASEEEFKQLAEIEFQKRIDHDYGYAADLDELHFEEVEDLGELPF